MKTDRRSIRRQGVTVALLLALAALTPLDAQAGPLLSGYGGPGQGNQAILGSTLLGGSGGGGSSGGNSAAGVSGGEALARASGAAESRAAKAGASTGPRHRGTRARATAGTTSAGQLRLRSYPAVETTAGGSGGLGLSGSNVLYIVVAAVALAFTGALTRIVAGPRTAKGH